MGTAPAAVTVVTTLGPSGEPRGSTVAAVTSVSAEPPSLLIRLDHRRMSLPDLLSAGRFGVNHLRGDRADVSQRFSSPLEERFAGVEWHADWTGVPIRQHGDAQPAITVPATPMANEIVSALATSGSLGAYSSSVMALGTPTSASTTSTPPMPATTALATNSQ